MPKRARKADRVAHLDLNSFPYHEFRNGAAVNLREVFRRLGRRGSTCAVLTIFHREISQRKSRLRNTLERTATQLMGVSVIEYMCWNPPETDPESYRAAVSQAISDFAPDTVMVNAPAGGLLVADVLAAELLANSDKNVFHFVDHDFFPRSQNRDPHLYRRYRKAVAKFSTMCPSEFTARRILESGLAQKVQVFPNLFTIKDVVGPSTDRRMVTMVNPHPVKGIAILEETARQMPHVQFQVVQGWPMGHQVFKTAQTNITVVPFHRDIRVIWEKTKLLLVPSLCNEAYGRVVVEAMLNGIPVLATRIGALPEILGRAGILIDPPPILGHPAWPRVTRRALNAVAKHFAEAVKVLLEDPDWYSCHSHAARSEALRICDRAERAFDRVVNGFNAQKRAGRSSSAGTLLLSPHSDDVALALGGILRQKILRPPVRILTVFGKSNHRGNLSFDDDWQWVTLKRRLEDQTYANRVGVDLTYMELPDAAISRGRSEKDIFIDDRLSKIDIAPNVDALVREMIDRYDPKCILAPLGLGGHYDHLILNKIALDISDHSEMVIAFYEDLPYAAAFSEAQLRKHVSCVDSHLRPIYIPIGSELAKKTNDLREYDSQMDQKTIEAVERHAQRRGRENVAEWLWSRHLPDKIFSTLT